MRVPWFVPVVVVASWACTHHRPLSQLSEVLGRDVEILTDNGEKLDGELAQIEPGLVFLTRHGAFDADLIVWVRDFRAGLGALEGMAVGVVIGATAGAVAAWRDTPNVETLGVLSLCVLGGAVIGALRGSRIIYSDREQPRFVPSGPPGSVLGITRTF
jgi:hypothetical protein